MKNVGKKAIPRVAVEKPKLEAKMVAQTERKTSLKQVE